MTRVHVPYDAISSNLLTTRSLRFAMGNVGPAKDHILPMASQSPGDSHIDNDDTDVLTDGELIAATRGGDTAAYGRLYERHVDAARRLARALAKDAAEADDLVSETFARLLATLVDGRGPDLAFRAYLLTTLRNTFYDRTRRNRKVELTDDMTRHDHGEVFEDPAVASQERRYAARAFHRLPERWQVVLWHTEVEGESAADIAPLLGLTPNGVSALAYRARERLRQMYLQEHIGQSPQESCRWTADRLGARVRGGLANRDSLKVDEHLRGCAACGMLLLELTEVNSGMREVLAFLIMGVSAPVYLGASGTAKTVAAGWFAGGLATITETGRAIADWARRILQHLGGRVVAATGAATAVLAAALILVLVANSPAPEPEAYADPAPQTTPDESDDDPDEQEEPDEPDDDPTEDPDEPDDDPADDPDDETEETAGDYVIDTDVTLASLTAGGDGTLPITLTAPDAPPGRVQPVVGRPEAARTPPTSGRVTLSLTVPAGVSSRGGDVGDGWTCESGTGSFTCERGPLSPGQTTVASLVLSVPGDVTGFHTVEATVSGGGFEGNARLRTPVAPAGTTVAYASDTEATGIATAGNTLLSCIPRSLCHHGFADNHTSLMAPYSAPGAPPGLAGDTATSGSFLSVPSGARILWAGLYWASSTNDAPPPLKLMMPSGGWHDITATRGWSGHDRPVYQSAADITGMVSGSGEYWVGVPEDALPNGPTHYAGWGITVVYQESGAAPRETAVYEGLAQPGAGGALTVDVPHGGDMQVGYTLWDGDRTLTGDDLTVGTNSVGNGNIGYSTCLSALEGGDWHTFGVDVADHRVTTGPGPSPVTVSVGSDPLDIGVLAVAAPPPPR